jgi:hypothetical protein
MDKKLYVISVATRELSVIAAFKDGLLFVQKIEAVSSARQSDLQKARHVMKEYKSRGFFVTVSEPLARFSPGFHTSSLASKDGTGQPRLVDAITAYQQLNRRNALMFADGVRKVSIPDSVYEKEVSDAGVISYRIDWDSISDEALALLVTVYNCVFHTSTESTYLKSVFNAINHKKRRSGHSLMGMSGKKL